MLHFCHKFTGNLPQASVFPSPQLPSLSQTEIYSCISRLEDLRKTRKQNLNDVKSLNREIATLLSDIHEKNHWRLQSSSWRFYWLSKQAYLVVFVNCLLLWPHRLTRVLPKKLLKLHSRELFIRLRLHHHQIEKEAMRLYVEWGY